MGEFFRKLFDSDFMPHGHCYFWQPSLLWLHVVSDALIALSYYSIPITLYFFICRRTDIKLRGLILMFAGFIVACGTTHILSIWDVWHSAYRLEGLIKAVTAVLSIATAIATIRVVPLALRIASPEQLSKVNQSLLEAETQRESENQFRDLAESIPTLAWMADETGHIFWYNRRWYDYTGTTFEQMEGWGWKSVHDPAALPQVMERWQAAIASETPFEMVFPLRRADGVFRPFLTRIQPIRDTNGRLVRWFGSNTDVNDQEEHRLAANASEEKLRLLIEAAPQGIIGISANGRISLVNRGTEQMFGYSRSELLGKELETLLPHRFRHVHAGHRVGYFEEPRVRAMGEGLDLSGRRKDGTEFPIEIGLSFVNTPEGTLAFGMVSDISERKRAADDLQHVNEELRRSYAELIASEDKLRSCFEAASQAILGVSTDGRIVMVNRRTEEMFGYARAELLGEELEKLLPDRSRRAHAGHRDGYFREPRTRAMGAGMELSGRRKDGTEFAVEIGLGYADTPDGPLAFGMVNDVSDRKKSLEDLERLNQELLRTNAEIEQFAHVASHDLQEPLRMVTSYLQLIERRYKDSLDDDGREFIGFAVDGARRMKGLIKDLLEFSRAGANPTNLRPVPAGHILKNAIDNLKSAVEEAHAEITADPLPTIVADPGLLTQVFQNLIANAIKFRQKGVQPAVHISARREESLWVFSVSDNGIGIEERHLERIFRIFERLHSPEEYTGSGIGLSIIRKIVERHGGKTWVESQPGTGSTFFFSISAETALASTAK